MMTIRQSPYNFGVQRSRWRLKDLLIQFMSWMKITTLQGVWYVLTSLKITYKTIRQHIHSPDPDYEEKTKIILESIIFYIPNQRVVLFQDECTVYSKKSNGSAYELVNQEPTFELGYDYEKQFRIVATLDVYTGNVVYIMRNKITIATLIEYYKYLMQVYKEQEIFLIQDNWPIHWHPDVRATLKEQNQDLAPFPGKLPASWKNIVAKNKYMGWNLNIQTIHLPTYASWLNPIEKLWRWLKQDIIHKHPFTDDIKELRFQTQNFLDQFKNGSKELLQYTGLLAQNGEENFFTQSLNTIFTQFGYPKIWDG